VTFTYQAAAPGTATLATDFADGCGTAFANMSRTLTAQQLTSMERGFGIGASWKLPLSAFSGAAPAVSGEAQVAAQATGTGGVLMSPLGMASRRRRGRGGHRALARAPSTNSGHLAGAIDRHATQPAAQADAPRRRPGLRTPPTFPARRCSAR
jgi:hypothetical protein